MKKELFWPCFRQINIFMTLWVNLRIFPLSVALKMPIWVFGKMKMGHVHRGCVEFDGPVRRGLLRIGLHIPSSFCMSSVSSLVIWGKLKVHGHSSVGNGVKIGVAKNAVLELGNFSRIGPDAKVYCEDHIVIGQEVGVSWESQIFDTNFHYYVHEGMIKRKNGPVVIGHHCWIGNRSTISKNAKLPPYSIVASNSLVNKDFSSNKEGGIYVGQPARLVQEDCMRILKDEGVVDEIFNDDVERCSWDLVKEKIELAKQNYNNYTDKWNC
jgi:acetyltransferase-like isoleucine patch superfamily enzyme